MANTLNTATASFTDAGDTCELTVQRKGTDVVITQSDADQQTVNLQVLVGSKGSGAYQTVKSWASEAATITYTYTTQADNETIRMFLSVDGGGTNAIVMTEQPREVRKLVDEFGNEQMVFFSNGGQLQENQLYTLDSATYVLDREEHAGKILLLDRSGGIDIDLPDATGSGDVYKFLVATATADAYEISAFDVGDDDVFGVIVGVDSADNAEFTWGAAANNNTVTLGGTSQATGGSVGDYVEFIDFAAGSWHVHGYIRQGGTEATPFSTDS